MLEDAALLGDAATLALIGATFLLAGLVKGVVGFGLPTVSLALLAATLGLHAALALLLLPTFVTNLWQGLAGGQARALLARLWPFLLAAMLFIWLGAQALRQLDLVLLTALLGLLLVLYALYGLLQPRLALPRRHERWAGPLLGAVNGVLSGMSGSFVFPGVPYLQAIGLARDQLVQAMGLLFTLSSLGLAVALGDQRLLTAELGAVSAVAVLPALAGLWCGQRLRRRLREALFRRVFLGALLLLGLAIVGQALGSVTP
jgi:uncharacterized membrane protein YfcA